MSNAGLRTFPGKTCVIPKSRAFTSAARDLACSDLGLYMTHARSLRRLKRAAVRDDAVFGNFDDEKRWQTSRPHLYVCFSAHFCGVPLYDFVSSVVKV